MEVSLWKRQRKRCGEKGKDLKIYIYIVCFIHDIDVKKSMHYVFKRTDVLGGQ